MAFPHFTKEPARAALAHRMRASVENNDYEEGSLTGYCQLVGYLLETDAVDDVIGEAKADFTNYQRPESMSAVRYSQKHGTDTTMGMRLQ